MAASFSTPGVWRRLTGRFTMHDSTRVASFFLAIGVFSILAVSFSSRVLARLLRSGTEPETLDSIADFFSIDGERNFPATASGLLFVSTAILCLFVAAKSAGRARLAWAFFGVTTIAMASDEVFEIHERFLRSIGEGLGFEGGGTIFFVWVIPGAVVALGLIAVAAWLTRPLARWQRIGALSAAIIFFTGALVVETLTGALFKGTGSNLLYVMLQVVEEGMEFTGEAVMFLVAFESLRRLRDRQPLNSESVNMAAIR